LDVAATCDQAGHDFALGVVNRGRQRAITAQIELVRGALPGTITAYEISAATAESENSFARPEEVSVHRQTVPVTGGAFDYTFAPHSVTVLCTTSAGKTTPPKEA